MGDSSAINRCIDSDGYNGAVTGAEGGEVGVIGLRLEVCELTGEPESSLAKRMGGRDPFGTPLPTRLTTDLPSAELVGNGKVDVQADVLRKTLF